MNVNYQGAETTTGGFFHQIQFCLYPMVCFVRVEDEVKKIAIIFISGNIFSPECGLMSTSMNFEVKLHLLENLHLILLTFN